MNKENFEALYAKFSGWHKVDLELKLFDLKKQIATMVAIEDLPNLTEQAEVIETILKERDNGAQ